MSTNQNKKDLDKYITENREIIDEFIGPNQDAYIEISLKGKLWRKIGSKDALQLFALWNEEKLTIQQKIQEMNEILYGEI